MIQFEEKHFLDVEFRLQISDSRLQNTESCLQIDPGLPRHFIPRNDEKVLCVTNPPYGVRLGQESEELVEDLVSAFARYSLSGGFLLLRGLQAP